MKHGIKCSYWEKPADTPTTWFIDKAAKLGFDVMELETRMVKGIEKPELIELRKYAADKNITLTLGSGPAKSVNLCSADPVIRKNAIDFRLELIEKAAIAGITTIGGGLYSYWPVDFSEPLDKAADRERAVTGMQAIAKAAEDNGITLCVEPVNRFENHILNTAQESVDFCRDVGSDNVKILLDTFHMNIEEDSIPAAIRTAGKYLGHFHTGEANRRVPGKGHIPWRQVYEALADVDFEGVEVMEPFVRSDGAAAKTIHVWRMLVDGGEEQMDADAVEGLALMRAMYDSAHASR